MPRNELFIVTDDGRKVIQGWNHPTFKAKDWLGYICEVKHESGYTLFLTEPELREFIRHSWYPSSKCPHWRHNECWGGRQHRSALAPPASCVGCQLRQVLLETRGDDLRLPPCQPRSPWPMAIAIVGSVGGVLWAQFGALHVQAERDRESGERVTRERAAKAGVVTFRRQSVSEKSRRMK